MNPPHAKGQSFCRSFKSVLHSLQLMLQKTRTAMAKKSPFPAKMQFLAQFLLLFLLLAHHCNCVFPLEFGLDEDWRNDDTAGFVIAEQPRVRKLIRPPPLKRAIGAEDGWRPILARGWARRNAVLIGNILF